MSRTLDGAVVALVGASGGIGGPPFAHHPMRYE